MKLSSERGVKEFAKYLVRKNTVRVGISISSPMTLSCNNKVAIEIAKNPVHHDKTEHIKIVNTSLRRKTKTDLYSYKLPNSEHPYQGFA